MENAIQDIYENFKNNGNVCDITQYDENSFAVAVSEIWGDDFKKVVKILRRGNGVSANWGDVQNLNKSIRNGEIGNVVEIKVKNKTNFVNVMLLAKETERLNKMFKETMSAITQSNAGNISVVLTCINGDVKYRAISESGKTPDENDL